MSETFTTKLGTTSKAGERTRIWLEGKRLIAAGFTVGARFERFWDAEERALTLMVRSEAEFAKLARDAKGTVSGKGDKPIIDIVGARVAETFTGSHVNVRFAKSRIYVSNVSN